MKFQTKLHRIQQSTVYEVITYITCIPWLVAYLVRGLVIWPFLYQWKPRAIAKIKACNKR